MMIDCDMHVYPNGEEITSFLKQPWRHRFSIRNHMYYKKPIDSTVPSTDRIEPGKDVETLRKRFLVKHNISQAILIPLPHASANHDPDYGAAVASAYNEWLAETWLTTRNPDGMFKGTICISHQDPQLAAKEIERWAGHPHFVQVLMESGARAPFGQRQYYPIYEACSKYNLPLVIHPAGEGMGVNKPVWLGYPVHYLEYYTGFSFAMQAHLSSLLTEGVFERFKNLRVVIAEGGVSWIPPMLWRLDQSWKALRSEVPWVKQLPSQYVKQHVRFTTQPLEKGPNSTDLLEVLEMVDAGNLLLFSSDFPNGNFVDMVTSLPALPEAWRSRILYDNAKAWYGL
jgi:predicted TIM-barrel fold metal-dependent hydrolase